MSKTVLIIEDDEASVKYLQTLIAESGYKAISAGDGAEGIKKAMEDKPDLVVLDVMMPKKSGFGVFQSMKKEESLKKIPVIMLTSIKSVIEEGREKGGHTTFEEMKDFYLDKLDKLVGKHRETGDSKPEVFMDKPIDPEDFLKAVTRLIGQA